MGCVAGDGSTAARAPAAPAAGETDGLASLQHLTEPGEEEEGEQEEEEEEGGGAFSSRDEEVVATASTAAPAEPAAPEKRRRDDKDTTNAIISTVVSEEDNGAPIDWILSRRLPENSRRFYRKALEAGDVKVSHTNNLFGSMSCTAVPV